MLAKSTLQLLTFLCFTKTFQTQSYRTMSNLTGIHSVVYVTVPPGDIGKTLAHGLIEKKLAACVNIVPKIMSIYKWKGEIVEDEENLMMIKTRTDAVDALTKYVKENHPYEVCEVISIPIKNGNIPYLQFIDEMVPSIEKREADEKNKDKNI